MTCSSWKICASVSGRQLLFSYLNDQGQKLFTSIEIWPNFAGSGKSYLTGLAVTDTPSSLGTQELYFSRRTNKATYYAASVELGAFEEEPQGEVGKLIGLLTGIFKRFATDPEPVEPTTPTETEPPMDEATATALKALLAQLLIVAAGIQAVIEPVAEQAPEPEPEPIEDVQAAVDGIVTAAEEEREFSRKGGATNKALLASMDKLQKQFTALQNTSAGRQLPRNPGPVNPPRRKVL